MIKEYYYTCRKGNGWGNYTLYTEMVDGKETITSCNDDTSGSGSSQIYYFSQTFEGDSPEPRKGFKLRSVEIIGEI